jgi:hypothetical protein
VIHLSLKAPSLLYLYAHASRREVVPSTILATIHFLLY